MTLTNQTPMRFTLPVLYASKVDTTPDQDIDIPLFQMARAILGARLSYEMDSGEWTLNGKPTPIIDVVTLANQIQQKRGKKNLLAYPRIATRYDYGLCGMMVQDTYPDIF